MQVSPKPAREDNISYRPDIDGLRAIAVLLVVVFHFHLFSAGKSGFVGVDVFFVISGYLITAIVRGQAEAGHFSLAAFWVKRLRRLVPALFVVLALVLAYGALRLLPSDFQQLAEETLATQFYYANVYFWRNVNYFGLQAGSIYLLHTWSLSVEEQFYIVYPLLLVWALRLGPRRALWLVLVAALVSFGLNVVFVGAKPEATFYLMPTRAWELLIGALLTWAPRVRQVAVAQLLGMVGAALVIAAVAGYDGDTRFPGTFALLPTLGAACLILAGTAQAAWSTRVLSLAPMVAIGRMSYSLYLVHWPINVFASREFGAGYTLGWRLAMVALCFVMSAVLYRWVETPFRHGRLLPERRRFLTGYGSGLAACVALCVAVIATRGVPARLPPEVTRMAAFANDRPSDRCPEFRASLRAESSPLCAVGAVGRLQEWLVWGDSHAWAAREAIDQWLQERGQGGRFAYLNSCPPLRGVHIHRDGGTCHAFNEQMLAVALRDPQVRKIFLVSTWRQAIEGRLSTAPDRHLPVPESVTVFQQGFDATVAELRAKGKEVYVWEPLPGARDHVPRRMASALLNGEQVSLDFSVTEYRQEYSFFFQALQRSQAGVTASFSPSQVLCRTGSCATLVEGQPVYFDNGHLARSGSARWARELAAQLGGVAAPTARPMP